MPHQRAPLFPKHPAAQVGTPPCPPLPMAGTSARGAVPCAALRLCAVLHVGASHAPRVLRNLLLIRTLFGFVGEESDEYFQSP